MFELRQRAAAAGEHVEHLLVRSRLQMVGEPPEEGHGPSPGGLGGVERDGLSGHTPNHPTCGALPGPPVARYLGRDVCWRDDVDSLAHRPPGSVVLVDHRHVMELATDPRFERVSATRDYVVFRVQPDLRRRSVLHTN